MSKVLFCITIALSFLFSQTNGLYFYLSKGMKKCFKDDVIKYSVKQLHVFLIRIPLQEIEASVKLLDQEAIDFIQAQFDSKEHPEGIQLELFQPDGSMYGQFVKNEMKYTFNTTQSKPNFSSSLQTVSTKYAWRYQTKCSIP